ncbi:hypothetical protein JCM15519_10050 [Fundidesulfovibrio butyratiphilus]
MTETRERRMERLLAEGSRLHDRSYPFGHDRLYGESVRCLAGALAALDEAEDPGLGAEIRYRLEDAMGDHAYYLEENYAQAAAHYRAAASLAAGMIRAGHAGPWSDRERFATAMAEESIGLTDADGDRPADALRRYCRALLLYAAQDTVYDRHSAQGLVGEILKTLGKALGPGMPALAEQVLQDSLRYFDLALDSNRLWSGSGVSDNYERWREQILGMITDLRSRQTQGGAR